MTRTKKITVTVTTLLVLAIAAVLFVFAAPQSSRLVTPDLGVNKASISVQTPLPEFSGSLLADCPGCSPDGPH
jgi:hypothetical protein